MVRQYRYIDFQDRKEISTRYLNGDRVADIADGLGMARGANENLKGYIETPSVENLLVGIEAQAVQTEPAEN